MLGQLTEKHSSQGAELIPRGAIPGGNLFALLAGSPFDLPGRVFLFRPGLQYIANVVAEDLAQVVVGVEFVFVVDAD